jgi:hypothetical protein
MMVMLLMLMTLTPPPPSSSSSSGVATLSVRELFDFVVDPTINDSNLEAAVERLMEVASRYGSCPCFLHRHASGCMHLRGSHSMHSRGSHIAFVSTHFKPSVVPPTTHSQPFVQSVNLAKYECFILCTAFLWLSVLCFPFPSYMMMSITCTS